MAKVKVGINGFGRIGRAFFRLTLSSPYAEVVAINDLGSIDNLAYLLRRDSVYGILPQPVSVENGALVVGGKRIEVLAEKDPALIPWGQKNVQTVVESTGVFDSYEKASAHLKGGAQRVVISAPAKDAETSDLGATVLMGINDAKLKTCKVTSNASCTTNAASPLMAILDEKIGVEHALLNTTHSYTASQSLVDGPSKKLMREGRAAALNMVPSSTGAAKAVALALPSLQKKFDGVSVRVPTPAGSLVDITFVAKRATNADEVNAILRTAAAEERWGGVFTTTDEDLVSSDIVGNTHASIADLTLTRVVGGTLVKVFAWYDNEMGYANALLKHVTAASA